MRRCIKMLKKEKDTWGKFTLLNTRAYYESNIVTLNKIKWYNYKNTNKRLKNYYNKPRVKK